MQHIGLMMTRNEEDIIEEVMTEHSKYFDKILVLDGSDDKTPEIIQSFDNVVCLMRDEDISPGAPVRDGARQCLLQKAQEMFGYDGWFTLLHGDEIFHDNPIVIAELAEEEGANVVKWHAIHFFLHTTQRDSFRYDPTRSVQEQLLWYCPGFREYRQFKNKRGLKYSVRRHACVIPRGHNLKLFSKNPIYKHYLYRSPEQICRRAIDRVESNFQPYYKWIFNSVFVDVLPGYKVAKEFKGSFEEYETDLPKSTNEVKIMNRPEKTPGCCLKTTGGREIKLCIGVTYSPPRRAESIPVHPYHCKFIDDSWTLIDPEVDHVNVVKMNPTKLEYADESVEEIYSPHFLIRVSHRDVNRVLAEWHRVLKPGGKLHVNVPDIKWALEYYLKLCADPNAVDDRTRGHYVSLKDLDKIIWGGQTRPQQYHTCGFTDKSLRAYLQQVGFHSITVDKTWEAYDMQCLIARAYKQPAGQSVSCPDSSTSQKRISPKQRKVKVSYIIDHILDDLQIVNAVCDCNCKDTLSEHFDIELIACRFGESRTAKRANYTIHQIGSADVGYPAVDRIIRIIRDFNPNIIHMHGSLKFPSYGTIVERFYEGKQLVWEFGGGPTRAAWLDKLSAVLVAHRLQAERINISDRSKVIVRSRGCKLEIFKPIPGTTKEFDILQVGGFYGHKGQAHIVEICKEFEDVKVLFLGQQRHNTGAINRGFLSLQRYVTEVDLQHRIFFEDFSNPLKVPLYYARSKIFAWGSPTPNENPGTLTNRATAEAICCGVPLVGYKKCFPESEYIIDGETAILVDNKDDFRDAIQYLLSDEEERLRLSRNCRAVAEKTLDYRRNRDEFYINFYHKLVEDDLAVKAPL